MSTAVEAKMCTKCLEWKLIDDFQKDSRGKHGRRSACKDCRRPLVAAQVLGWKRNNRARAREIDRTYERNNRPKRSVKESRRRARKANVPHMDYSPTGIFARWGGKCCYCDAPATALDHVTPIARGGADAAFNLVPACTSCNSSKGAKSLAEWALTFAPKIVS